jgi:hypothetical protein
MVSANETMVWLDESNTAQNETAVSCSPLYNAAALLYISPDETNSRVAPTYISLSKSLASNSKPLATRPAIHITSEPEEFLRYMQSTDDSQPLKKK